MLADGANSGRPAPLDLRAGWPACRQLLWDAARLGAAAGAVLGLVAGVGWAWAGVVAGAPVGALLAALVGPRRYRLRIDGDGVHIGRLAGTTTIPWAEVVAVGRREDWHGRSGRVLGLAVCRRGELLPVPVPALTWTASAMRMGRDPAVDRLDQFRNAAVEPVRAWAQWAGVPVIEEDVDAWWDHHPAADP